MIPALFCIALPLAAIFILVAYSPRFGHGPGAVRQSTLLFSVWLAATVVFSPFTFVLKVPGLPDMSVDRTIALLVMFCALIRVYRHDSLSGQDKLVETLMFLFGVVCLISMARFGFSSSRPTLQKPSYIFLFGYCLPFMAFVYAKYFLSSERDMTAVFKTLFWLGVYLTVMAFLERSSYNYLVWPSYVTDPAISPLHLDRARGPFLNAAFNGVALNVAFLCGFMAYPSLPRSRRWLYVALLALMVPAVYLTRTRSVYLHFLVTLGGVLLLYKTGFSRWRILPALALACAILLAANAERFISEDREAGGLAQMNEVYIRLNLAEKSRLLLSENPIGGIGLAQFRNGSLFTPKEVEMQHNQLIGMAVELGLPGFLLYLCMLLVLFHRLCRLADFIPQGTVCNPNLVTLIALTLFVFLWNAFFVEPAMHLYLNSTLFAFAGVIDQLYNRYVLRTIV